MKIKLFLVGLFFGLLAGSANAQEVASFLEKSLSLKGEVSDDHFRLHYKSVFIRLWDVPFFEDGRIDIVPYYQSLAATGFNGPARYSYQCDLRFVGKEDRYVADFMNFHDMDAGNIFLNRYIVINLSGKVALLELGFLDSDKLDWKDSRRLGLLFAAEKIVPEVNIEADRGLIDVDLESLAKKIRNGNVTFASAWYAETDEIVQRLEQNLNLNINYLSELSGFA